MEKRQKFREQYEMITVTARFIIYFIVVCVIFGMGRWSVSMPVQAIEAQEAVILSPIDFQALLNRLEPSEPIVEDGKLSPD